MFALDGARTDFGRLTAPTLCKGLNAGLVTNAEGSTAAAATVGSIAEEGGMSVTQEARSWVDTTFDSTCRGRAKGTLKPPCRFISHPAQMYVCAQI